MLSLPAVPIAVALASALTAAVTDIWKYRIYNVLTWPLLASGLAYHSFAAGGIGFTVSAIAVCLGAVPMAVMYWLGGLGAGDVKLMAGLGSWLGPVMTVEVLLASWLAAGLYALAVLLYNQFVPHPVALTTPQLSPTSEETGDRVSATLASPDRRRKMIPFGLMIFAGVLHTLLVSGQP